MEEAGFTSISSDSSSEMPVSTKIPRSLIGGKVEFVQPREQLTDREPYTGIWTEAEVEE